MSENRPSTPPNNIQANIPTSELSPPDSHRGPQTQTSRGPANTFLPSSSNLQTATSAEMLNANGKRAYDAAGNGANAASGAIGASAMIGSANGSGNGGGGNGKYSHPSGYTWDKQEDAPGYGWGNPKAKEEAFRALSQIVDLDVSSEGVATLACMACVTSENMCDCVCLQIHSIELPTYDLQPLD